MPNDVQGTVSIPHRYDKNKKIYDGDIYELAKFQFLIGTIKTEACSKYITKYVRFQFLIGTIKT